MAARRQKGLRLKQRQQTPRKEHWLPPHKPGDHLLLPPDELLFEQMRKLEEKGIPKQWSTEMWPPGPTGFPREWTWHIKSKKQIELEDKWMNIARQDPFEAMIAIEEDLESLPLPKV